MGISGRKPTPANLINPKVHKKSGEDIAKRKEVENKLRTKASLSCPKQISDEAKKEWRRLMRLYKSVDSEILCDLDIQTLIMYCEATAIYKKAQETWREHTAVVSNNEKVQLTLDRCLTIMDRQTRIICKLSEQLCITPMERARMAINASNKNTTSSLEALLNEDD